MSLPLKLLISWYFSIFIATELLSIFNLINRPSFIIVQGLILTISLLVLRLDLKQVVKSLIPVSKIYWVIIILALLTFLQGIIAAPSTTDSMVYHLPRVMYWVQDQSLTQDVIRNEHDFMSPFGEYILLSLFFITGNDRLFFLSQWLAFITTIYLSGLIAHQLGATKKIKNLTRLLTAAIPILVLQSSSTQIDLVVTLLVVASVNISLTIVANYKLKYVFALAFIIALGVLTKPTFLLYATIPSGILAYYFRKSLSKLLLIAMVTTVLILIITFRFFTQNLNLYGNLLGNHLLPDGQEVTYTNAYLSPSVVFSNSVRNLVTQIPIPVFNLVLENTLINLFNTLGIDINDSSTTCCGTFRVLPIIFPQEDIVANPLQILLILLGFYYLFHSKNKESSKLLMFLTITSFLVFSAVLKWQPYHSRLLIPVFVLGTISSISLLQNKPKLLLYLAGISLVMAFALIILNVSKPYISYSYFYNMIKTYSKTNSSIPEAFYLKPRSDQYFNARYYWNHPYNDIIKSPELAQENKTLSLILEDHFEYPLWVILKEQNKKLTILPASSKTKSHFLIKTSSLPEPVKDYNLIRCSETQIEYGFICLYTLKLNE